MPSRVDSKHCTVLNLGDAGARLVDSLDRVNRKHYAQADGGHCRLEYGLAGLAAVGMWINELKDEGKAHHLASQLFIPTTHAPVRVMPLFPQAQWYHLSEDQHRVIVWNDEAEVQAEQRAVNRFHVNAFSFPRALPTGEDVSLTFDVVLDLSGRGPSPPSRDYHAYFGLTSRLYPGLVIQSGPYLLYSALNVIRLTRDRQMSREVPMREWDDHATVVILEVLSLFLVARLCDLHGSEKMYLSARDWRTFVSSVDPEAYGHARSFIAVGALREGGRTARQAASWIVGQEGRHGGRDTPPSAADEQRLAEEIDEALRWVEGFFDVTPGSLRITKPAIQLRALGKASSPYIPQDRRLAAQF